MRRLSVPSEELRHRLAWRLVIALSLLLVLSNVGAGPAWTQQEAAPPVPAPPKDAVPGEILVKFEPGASASAVIVTDGEGEGVSGWVS